ncbi:histidine phosphatase family protein [Caldalkalibacillus salinus]|uniref:histidine phosphatase family protein n=1 Tax=Caldalkalibacillus salinus TaxID=2803787 RepID=UPI001921DC80|nr:histidine phosphatase family protein [Caldalkalibacillus salinus]
MKRIYLVRHCKATGQAPTASLTEEGQLQAEHLANFFTDNLNPIDFILSSTYARSKETIYPLAQKIKLKIHTDDRLSERILSSEDRVDWKDKLRESFVDLDMKLPGGESSREAMNRGIAVINEMINGSRENVIIITHGNLMSLMLKYFDDSYGFEEWKKLTNPDVYELTIPEKRENLKINRIWE